MGCCPMTYWCTPDGPVGVEADEDGVFTTPEGATGGPYATHEEAIDACPPPPFDCVCTDTSFSVPSLVYFTLSDLTGDLVGEFDANSYAVTVAPAGGGTDPGTVKAGGWLVVDGTSGVGWELGIYFICGGGIWGGEEGEMVVWTIVAPANFAACTGPPAWTTTSPWTLSAEIPDEPSKVMTTSPIIDVSGEEVGDASVDCSFASGGSPPAPLVGTFKLSLST